MSKIHYGKDKAYCGYNYKRITDKLNKVTCKHCKQRSGIKSYDKKISKPIQLELKELKEFMGWKK